MQSAGGTPASSAGGAAAVGAAPPADACAAARAQLRPPLTSPLLAQRCAELEDLVHDDARRCAPLDWEALRVGARLPSIYLIRDFLSAEEERQILGVLHDDSAAARDKWVLLKSRRLQSWGRHPDLPHAPMPAWLGSIAERLVDRGVFAEPPSHCLINAYATGQGVMSHEDGPSYRPRVATLSLGSRCVLRFHRRVETTMTPEERRALTATPVVSLVLPPRSAVIFTEAAYTDHLHGIRAVASEAIEPGAGFGVGEELDGFALGDTLLRAPRTSLTFRHTKEEGEVIAY